MNRRCPTKSCPGQDFRAVAADRPQRTLGLPVRTAPAAAALPYYVLDDGPDAVSIRARRRADGSRYVLVTGTAVLTTAADVRALARRLDAAAGALEDGTP